MAKRHDLKLSHMPRTFLSSDCIVLIIVMIHCCIIICVIFCIGRYILVEIKLQCSCIAIKLLSYCTSRVKEVKSETKSGQTNLSSDCIVLIIVMIHCCIIICVIFCIGRYILVEIKLQCSCIAIKLLSYCTSRVKEVKSETKSGQTCNRSHKPVHNFATTGARRSQRSKINQGHN